MSGSSPCDSIFWAFFMGVPWNHLVRHSCSSCFFSELSFILYVLLTCILFGQPIEVLRSRLTRPEGRLNIFGHCPKSSAALGSTSLEAQVGEGE